ncbi:GNAT family N-acetyltransferase [Saccharibacillus deserti]|uniref:GNAT family N-acetyltransferase n=1 Tax=Saccharibacillus deserti TaxID=1634444 RepID=UPI001551AAAE|nr:GNAT family N-acetyltransferase [Saccharibacillus deserti]
MIIINKLPAEAKRFQTYLPSLRDPLPPGAIGIEAEVDGLFAGTALVIAHPRSGTGSISVLHTQELFRHLGVGSLLLEEAERQILESGCRISRVTLTLRQGKPAPELEFLHKRGYESEKLLYRTYTLRSASLREEAGKKRLSLPVSAELRPLLDATEAERAELSAISANLQSDLNPLQEERLLHPEFSMLMKIDGRIAGWIGIQQLASNLLLLRSMYVCPEYRIHASGIALFLEIARRHRLFERFAYQMLSVSSENPAMLRLADRKFAPHASSIKTNMRLEKRL